MYQLSLKAIYARKRSHITTFSHIKKNYVYNLLAYWQCAAEMGIGAVLKGSKIQCVCHIRLCEISEY
jgi:hypothetical protein